MHFRQAAIVALEAKQGSQGFRWPVRRRWVAARVVPSLDNISLPLTGGQLKMVWTL